MRRAFGYSYQSLPPAEARAFRLLGLLTGPDITVDGAAALLDSRSHDAHRALDRLARAHLVARAGPGRFTLHDLLGAYAADRAREQDPDTAREAALDRWLDWCLATALAADRLLDPLRFRAPFDDFPTASRDPVLTTRAEAVAWLDAERANLVAAAFQAARHGRVQRAWHLAWALWSYFDLRKPWSDWIETYRLGLSCARAGGDRHGEAVMQYGLGVAHYYPRRFADALDCLRAALRLHRENGERRGEGTVLNCIANVRLESGDPVAAVALYRQALDIQVRAGSRRDESVVLNNLTEAYNKLGRHREAVTCAQRALDLAREGGSRRGEFFPLCHLANALAATGDRARARELLAGALALADENRDPHARAWALCYIGAIARDEGRVREARQAWRESVGLFASLGDPNGEDVLARLAELDGQPPADAGRGPGSVGEEPEPKPCPS
jgi:tetratricopeptide (TPR) repeat protein